MPSSRLGLIVTFALVGALSACGGSAGGDSGGGSAAPATTVAAAASPASDTTTEAAASGGGSGVPTPTGDDREHLLFVLEAVNPGMGTDEDALVKKSVTVCGAILGGKSKKEIQALTKKEFTNGSWTPFEEETDAIDATITSYFCR